MTPRDGIHFNRWQRSAEIEAALQTILRERGIDVRKWRSEWWQHSRPQSARQIFSDLVSALVSTTGCDADAARRHITRLIRIRKTR